MPESCLGIAQAIEARGWKGDKQVNLIFTSERMIVIRKGWLADIAGSGVGATVGGLILQVPLSMADSSSQKKKEKELEKEDFNQIIEKHKGSYDIPYSDITKADMKTKLLGEWWIELISKTGEYRFKRIIGDEKRNLLNPESIANILGNQLSDRFSLLSKLWRKE